MAAVTPRRPSATGEAPPATPITDFSAIESQKENIQPLSTGRSAHALSTIFAARPKQLEREFREGRERFEEELREVEERRRSELTGEDTSRFSEEQADPLDVFERYVKYIREAAPSGSTQSSILIPLLERCTRTLLGDETWAQDFRYIRLWIQYSRLIDRKQDVFEFLLAREVGTDWSGLYEEYANVMEELGKRAKADEIYRLGIARRAKPLDRLQHRYKSFQVRIMQTPAAFLPPETAPAPSSSAPSSSSSRSRSTLGTLSAPSGSSSGSIGTSSASSTRANNGKKMAIFVDSAVSGGAEDGTSSWEGELGTRDTVRKENERDAVAWQGEILPQGRPVAPRTPKLEVFRDESATTAVPSAQAVDDVFTRSSAPPEWEKFIQDPLANMRAIPGPAHAPAPAPTPAPSSKRPPTSSNPTGFITEMPVWTVPDSTPPIAKNGKPEIRRFKWDMVFRDGKEWSFEECRARSMGMLGKDIWISKPASHTSQTAPAPAPAPTPAKQPEPTPPRVTAPSTAQRLSIFPDPVPEPKPVSQPLFAPIATHAAFAPTAAPSLPPPPPPASALRQAASLTPVAPTPKPRTRPSPTINTKAAMADVMEMYNAGAGESDEDEEDSDDDDNDSEDEDAGPVMMIPEQGAVPPTPTPAQGHHQNGRLAAPSSALAASSISEDVFTDENMFSPNHHHQQVPPALIFRDENAVPPGSAPRPTRTPARTPLSTRKPTFEVFSDAPGPTPSRITTTSSPPALLSPPRQTSPQATAPPSPPQTDAENYGAAPLPPHEVFATPMPESKQPFRRGVGFPQQQLTEEDEEEAERQEDEYDEMEYRSNRGVWDGRVGGFELMTPITERTCEYTSTTGGGRISFAGMSGRASMSAAPDMTGVEEEDEEEVIGASADQAFIAGEEQQQQLRELHLAPASTAASRETTPDFESFDRSGSTPFALTEGYTIDGHTGNTTGMLSDQVIVDQQTEPLNLIEEKQTSQVPPSSVASFIAAATDTAKAPSSPLRPSIAKVAATATAVPSPRMPTPPNPCNPMDPEIMTMLIASADPSLTTLSGFRDLTAQSAGRLDGLQKVAKQKVRRGSTGSSKGGAVDHAPFGTVDLDGWAYEITDKIGEGGFGAVFLAKDLTSGAPSKRDGDEEDEDLSDFEDEDDDDLPSNLVALKVEKPAGIWEGLVLQRVKARLNESLHASIISSKALFAYSDESYLVLDYSSQGTLLDAVNQASKLGIASTATTAGGATGLDELVVCFFTVELLKVVEHLHRNDFIHGDLKIDNCLVRLDEVPGGNAAWSSQYDPWGGGGWSSKGIKMIDFGKSIDLKLWPEGQTFVAEWAVDQRDCVEMREARPWTFQTDYFGLASVCYCMLFGKYIETAVASSEPGAMGKRYKIATPLKRYWQTDLWTRLFDLLLNPRMHSATFPICDELAAIRAEMAQWVADKCTKDGKNLRSLLKKLEMNALSK